MLVTKTHEGDLVELTEDLQKYNLKQGARGFVIEAFDQPNESYDIEFEDEEGEFIGFAYSVKPDQIINLASLKGDQNANTYATAKASFDHGFALFNSGRFEEAECHFRNAIKQEPRFIGVLSNIFVTEFGNTGNWVLLISALQFVRCINPSYAMASCNLAIAYLNYGVEQARVAKVEDALGLFRRAITIPSSPEIVEDIRTNLAAAHTTLGIREHEAGKLDLATAHMLQACEDQPSNVTRSNLARAYAYRAEAFMEDGKIEEAIAFFERAQDTGFIPPSGLNNYGIALAQTSHFREAVSAFERALMMLPDDEVIAANLQLAQTQKATALKLYPLEISFEPPTPFRSHEWQSAA